MTLKVQRVDTWAAAIEDKTGGLATKLNALTGAGVNLDFVIARRTTEKAGTEGVCRCAVSRRAAVVRPPRDETGGRALTSPAAEGGGVRRSQPGSKRGAAT